MKFFDSVSNASWAMARMARSGWSAPVRTSRSMYQNSSPERRSAPRSARMSALALAFFTSRDAERGLQGCGITGEEPSVHRTFHLATLGSARALYMDDRIGRLVSGHEADFAVPDLSATPLLLDRLRFARQPGGGSFRADDLGRWRLRPRDLCHGSSGS